MLRNGDDELTDPSYHEALSLYGLLESDFPQRVILLNVGGELFHFRESVGRKIPYLDSKLRWLEDDSEDALLDFSKSFLDRNPSKFRNILAYVENSRHEKIVYDKLGREATFYGIEYDDAFVTDGDIDGDTDGDRDKYKLTEASAKPMMSVGPQDAALNIYNSPQATIHKSCEKRLTKSAYTYNTFDMKKSDTSDGWQLLLTQKHDLIGDCWLNLDLQVSLDDFPTSLWDQCHIIDKIDVKIDEVSEILTAPALFILMIIEKKAMTVSVVHNNVRMTVPLYTYWWRTMSKKLPVSSLRSVCSITCTVNTVKITACSLTCTCWSLSQEERRMFLQSMQYKVLMHDSVTFHTQSHGETFIHDQQLPFENPTKDVIVVVRPRYHQDGSDPVLKMELLLDGQVCLSLDGVFARTLLAQHLYGIHNTDLVYFLPFDHSYGHSSQTFDTSTCNLSQFKSVHLRMTLLAGQYDVFVMSRFVNLIRMTYGRIGVCLQKRTRDDKLVA